ncbi:MAG: ribose-5-phosphate isomerase RpiA [Thermoplasmata archaeon]
MGNEQEKEMAAKFAVKFIKNGMFIGLGTGSTTKYFIRELALAVKSGLKIKAVASSEESSRYGKSLGIDIIDDIPQKIDLTVDGADEVDKYGNLIKGGGGALLREKILAYNSREMYVIIDSSKKKETLGSFPLPIEIAKFAYEATLRNIESRGGKCQIRKGKDGMFITDNGNYIVDCNFGKIEDPEGLERSIKTIPGVVEVGIFHALASKVIMGGDNECTVFKCSADGEMQEENNYQ